MKKCKICKKAVKWGKYATKKELATGVCVACMQKPFAITSVARADLLENFRARDIARLDDYSMDYIARKMADSYVENSFWVDLDIVAINILEDIKIKRQNNEPKFQTSR